jgi:hypothetical protein
MTNFEIIRTKVMESTLSAPEKMSFINSLADFTDEALKEVSVVIAEDPTLIETLNENRKKKVTAFSTNDPMLWKEIFAEEQKIVDNAKYDRD